MNSFKRAATSITRNLGKTIILLCLIFILGSLIAGAISVREAIHNTDANLKRNMRPLVSVFKDFDAWDDYVNTYYEIDDFLIDFEPMRPFLAPEDVHFLGQLEYVYFYDYFIQWGMLESREFIRDYTSEYNFWNESGGLPTTQFPLMGTAHTELIQVEQEAIRITQGRQFEPYEHDASSEPIAAIVSEKFANHNNLSLHSIFTLGHWFIEPDERGSTRAWESFHFDDDNILVHLEFEFEIVGIFELGDQIDADDYDEAWRRWDLLYTIYVPNWAVEEISGQWQQTNISILESFNHEWLLFHQWHGQNPPDIISVFALEDPLYMDDFIEAATPYLPEFHQFENMSITFDAITSSMVTLRSIADWVLWTSILATISILSLLIILFLRDRRYEMGVYLALGEKKGKIISQILMEVLVISFIAISVSIFIGNTISETVSHQMLMNELIAEDDELWLPGSRSRFHNLGLPVNNLSIDEMIDQFDIVLDIQTVSLFYAIGLGTVGLSTIVPVIYIIKLNPKENLLRGDVG